MNIQQNVNALLTLGAVAARSSDKYQTQAEIRKTSKQSRAVNTVINKEAATLQENEELLKTDPTALKEDVTAHLQHAQQRIDIDEKMAQLDPSEENLNEASESRAFLRAQQEKYKGALQESQSMEIERARNSSTAVEDMKKIIAEKGKNIKSGKDAREVLELLSAQYHMNKGGIK